MGGEVEISGLEGGLRTDAQTYGPSPIAKPQAFVHVFLCASKKRTYGGYRRCHITFCGPVSYTTLPFAVSTVFMTWAPSILSSHVPWSTHLATPDWSVTIPVTCRNKLVHRNCGAFFVFLTRTVLYWMYSRSISRFFFCFFLKRHWVSHFTFRGVSLEK